MNIRKLFMSAIVTVMMLATATCFAQISVSELNIGGVYIGQPVSEVFDRFGEPSEVMSFRERESYFWLVSGSKYTYRLIVQSSSDRSGYVVVASSGDGSDLRTKAGIGSGASLASVKAIYGEPDEISWHKGMKQNKYLAGDYQMSFYLDGDTETVKTFGFSPNDFDGSSKPQTQQKPSQPQEPTRPKSTIPDSITQIPASELNLGWIEPGQPMNKVEQVYGKPSKIDDQGFFQAYNYNDKFIVKGKMSNGYKVTSVASYEKGMKTPSGFMVGDAYSAVVKKFGAVNGVKFKGEELEAKMKNLKGCTDYTYFSGNKQMVFLVDKKGIVQGIRVEDIDEQKFIEARRKK